MNSDCSLRGVGTVSVEFPVAEKKPFGEVSDGSENFSMISVEHDVNICAIAGKRQLADRRCKS